jgi:hypothetical protein
MAWELLRKPYQAGPATMTPTLMIMMAIARASGDTTRAPEPGCELAGDLIETMRITQK